MMRLALTLSLLCSSVLAQSYAPWTCPMQALLLQTATDTSWADAGLNTGLASYWAMRASGTTVYDEYGARNGTTENSPTFGTDYGKRDNGVLLNGTDQRINCGTPLVAVPPLTYAAWVRINKTGAFQTLISTSKSSGGGTAQHTITLGINTEQKPYIVVQREASIVSVAASTALATNQWAHVAGTMTLSGTSYTGAIFVNGVREATSSGTGTAPDTLTRVTVGATVRPDASVIAHFGGSIDEVAIWSRALTTNDVYRLYSGPLYAPYREN